MYFASHKSIYTIIIAIVAIGIATNCARITSPQGGPQDEEPPKLINSYPESGSTMFESTTIKLTFDERVKVENIQSNLLITPRLNTTFQTKVKKNEITLTFAEDFQENTTYTLSFGGTVADITNNNAVRNLNISFSTGPVIDSLKIEGQIKNLYTQKPVDEALIALYDVKDTLNILTGRASYYAYTDTAGVYRFQNLPANQYLVYGVIDSNNNGFANSDGETYGFYPDTVDLDQNLSEINFTLQKLNVDTLKIRSSSIYGPYYETTFNKSVTSFLPEPSDDFYYQQIETNTIRFYRQNAALLDTIQIPFQASDSTGYELQDTVSVIFRESDLNKEPLKINVYPDRLDLTDTLSLYLSKPVASYHADSIKIIQDSAIVYTFQPDDFELNPDRTVLKGTKAISHYIAQPGLSTIEGRPNAFISADNDSSALTTKDYQNSPNDDSAIISGTVNSNTSVIIQLLSARGEKVLKSTTNKFYSFSGLSAGQYKIRVIQDKNENQKWDLGNILLFQPPEPAKFYYDSFYNTDIIEVRNNWEINDANVNF